MQRISPLGWVAILSVALFALMLAAILLGADNPLRNFDQWIGRAR